MTRPASAVQQSPARLQLRLRADRGRRHLARLASLARRTGDVQPRIASGDTQQYRLATPAPLLIAYWTAEATPDGALRYYPDIYAAMNA